MFNEIEIHGTGIAGIAAGLLADGISYRLMVANMFINVFDVIIRETST
jgi:hypothetical protein